MGKTRNEGESDSAPDISYRISGFTQLERAPSVLGGRANFLTRFTRTKGRPAVQITNSLRLVTAVIPHEYASRSFINEHIDGRDQPLSFIP